MNIPAGIQRRLTLGVLVYAILIAIAVVLHGYLVNEAAEQRVWESLLESEFAHVESRAAQHQYAHWRDTDALQLFGALSGVPVPPEFATYDAGVHDEIERAGRQYVLLVRDGTAGRSVLALDISAMDNDEATLIWTISASSLALVLILVIVTYVGVGRLIRPLVGIARSIAALHPDSRGQRIAVPATAPREAVVIADALNAHLRRSDEFIARELDFIRMTSHELRTPIAVIASTAEVALAGDAADRPESRQLRRILQTARDMKELLVLLQSKVDYLLLIINYRHIHHCLV